MLLNTPAILGFLVVLDSTSYFRDNHTNEQACMAPGRLEIKALLKQLTASEEKLTTSTTNLPHVVT